jgi:hypothetical protein
MVRMSNRDEARREQIEGLLFRLGSSRSLLRMQVRLRICQAMERSEQLCDLLDPTLEILERIDVSLMRAQEFISAEIWRSDGHKNGH